VCDDLECITLVDEKLLAFCAVKHLLGIFGNKRVEERVEAFIVTPLRS